MAREFAVDARSTDTFGRVLCSARDQHFVVDGPVENGCPGEAPTPPEIFLAGVATCAVELVGVLARDRGVALDGVQARIFGTIDPNHQPHDGVVVFSSVTLRFHLSGVEDQNATALVQGFRER